MGQSGASDSTHSGVSAGLARGESGERVRGQVGTAGISSFPVTGRRVDDRGITGDGPDATSQWEGADLRIRARGVAMAALPSRSPGESRHRRPLAPSPSDPWASGAGPFPGQVAMISARPVHAGPDSHGVRAMMKGPHDEGDAAPR